MEWLGTFELWRQRDFAEIYAAGTGRELVERDGLLLFVSSRPIIGATTAYLYCPPSDAMWYENVAKCMKNMGAARIWIYNYERIGAFASGHVQELATSVTSLSEGEDTLWKRIGDKTRNMVRKGTRNGIVAGRAFDRLDFDVWWKIYESEARARNFEAQDRSLVENLFKRSDLSRLWIARAGGEIVGGCFFLVGDYPMYWLGAFSSDRRHLSPGHLTMWEAMKTFANEGFKLLDLGGISIGDEDGPTRFKKSFGGEQRVGYAYSVVMSRTKSWLLNRLTRGDRRR